MYVGTNHVHFWTECLMVSKSYRLFHHWVQCSSLFNSLIVDIWYHLMVARSTYFEDIRWHSLLLVLKPMDKTTALIKVYGLMQIDVLLYYKILPVFLIRNRDVRKTLTKPSNKTLILILRYVFLIWGFEFGAQTQWKSLKCNFILSHLIVDSIGKSWIGSQHGKWWKYECNSFQCKC